MVGDAVPAPGGPHDLDALLIPPPAAPAPAGPGPRVRPRAVDREIEVAQGVYLPRLDYNGTVPGPVIRATEDDLLDVHFTNGGSHPHTIHFHGIHPATWTGSSRSSARATRFTYEFPARPYGMQLYHCHATPLKKHIHKGLYGAFIIDPPEPRRPAHELVMVMNGYDTDGDGENNFYTVNGKAFYYAKYPIRVQGEPCGSTSPTSPSSTSSTRSTSTASSSATTAPAAPTSSSTRTRSALPGRARDHRDRLAQRRPLHVPRPPDRVRRARLDGLLRRRGLSGLRLARGAAGRCALAPLVARAAGGARRRRLALRLRAARSRPGRAEPAAGATSSTSAGSSSTRARSGCWCEPPARRHHDRLGHRRRRDRPLHASTATATLGRLRSTTIVVPFDWVEDDPFTIGVTSSTGIQTTPGGPGRGRDARGRRSGFLGYALIGLLVGVVPVALGMPGCRPCGGRPAWLAAFMALTGRAADVPGVRRARRGARAAGRAAERARRRRPGAPRRRPTTSG